MGRPCRGILYSSEKEGTPHTRIALHGLEGQYAELEKQNEKLVSKGHTLYGSIYMAFLKGNMANGVGWRGTGGDCKGDTDRGPPSREQCCILMAVLGA